MYGLIPGQWGSEHWAGRQVQHPILSMYRLISTGSGFYVAELTMAIMDPELHHSRCPTTSIVFYPYPHPH